MTNVLITGASRRIGFGFVKKYLRKNVHVVVTTRDIKGSKEILTFKERFPKRLELLELDLLKENGGDTLASLTGDRPIDILINNALWVVLINTLRQYHLNLGWKYSE